MVFLRENSSWGGKGFSFRSCFRGGRTKLVEPFRESGRVSGRGILLLLLETLSRVPVLLTVAGILE